MPPPHRLTGRGRRWAGLRGRWDFWRGGRLGTLLVRGGRWLCQSFLRQTIRVTQGLAKHVFDLAVDAPKFILGPTPDRVQNLRVDSQ